MALLLLIVTPAFAQKTKGKSKQQLQTEINSLQKEISTANKLLKKTTKDKEMTLNEVTVLEKKIKQREKLITAYNEQSFLRQHHSIAFSDDSLFYSARILDYKVSDEISPLEVQQDNIRSIILNHRKIDVLNKLHADLLKEAEKGGHVKNFVLND